MSQRRRPCELCAGEAAVYCDSDTAYLCWDCDAAVHGANFLVARHVRRVACAACHSLDDGAPRVSGAGPGPRARAALCLSCDPRPACPPSPTADSACSSSCLSTSESTAAAPPRELATKRRRRRVGGADGRAEEVLICWCRRMGIAGRLRSAAAVAAAAAAAACEGVVAALPFRVALAAALWFAVKRTEDESPAGGDRRAALRRLEACSGVPARLIVVAESRIARSAGRVRVVEEDWAECS